ncbi:MAG TPA: hypothetical protein VMX38_16235 [Verrucomicrobiae bacterium]|nr:hypothetical protein [Verrucomicrobiae bacterium]
MDLCSAKSFDAKYAAQDFASKLPLAAWRGLFMLAKPSKFIRATSQHLPGPALVPAFFLLPYRVCLTPVDQFTMFASGSNAKAFTSAALATLVDTWYGPITIRMEAGALVISCLSARGLQLRIPRSAAEPEKK